MTGAAAIPLPDAPVRTQRRDLGPCPVCAGPAIVAVAVTSSASASSFASCPDCGLSLQAPSWHVLARLWSAMQGWETRR